MAGQAVPYDPYEERRRRMLAMGIPTPQDVPAFLPPVQTASQLGPMPLAPSQAGYEEVLAQQPTRAEHQPGMLRKILAAAAGGATGWRAGAPAGIEAARRITSLPYEQAMGDWERRRGAAQSHMELESSRRAEELEHEKLGLQRQEVGDMGNYRRLMGEYYARPPTERPMVLGEGQQAFSPSGEPIAGVPPRGMTPQRPMSVSPGGVAIDPTTGEVIHREPHRPSELTFEQRRQLAGEPSRAAAEHRIGRQPDVDELQNAQSSATMHVMLSHPEYEDFFDVDDSGVPYTERPEAGWDETKKQLYNQMLADIEAEKEAIISRLYGEEQVGGTPGYSVEKVRD